MNHADCRSLFVEALYDELPAAKNDAFREHLRSCPSCSAAFSDLERVGQTMDMRRRDELSAADWIAFWNTLEPVLEKRQPHQASGSGWTLPVWFGPRTKVVTVAMTFLIVGILAGRFFSRATDAGTGGVDAVSPSGVERVAARQEAMEYLERSKILLLGIVNAGEDVQAEPERLKRQREYSRNLVEAGGTLRNRLTKSGEQQLEELVGDLEVILLQIANLEVEHDFPGLELIRGGVDRKGILLKINVEEMKAGRRRPTAEPNNDQNSPQSMI